MTRKIVIFLLSVLCFSCTTRNDGVQVLEPLEFQAALEQDTCAILLDVRKPEEFAEGHLPNAISMNWLDETRFQQEALTLKKSETLYVYCKGGIRSKATAKWLAAQGFKVIDLKGGITAWRKAELPIEIDESSLE